jgi:hypothetical protein
MNVKTRLLNLEKQVGTYGSCQHGWYVRHVNDDGDQVNVLVPCPECGKLKNVITVVHTSNWHAREEDGQFNDD